MNFRIWSYGDMVTPQIVIQTHRAVVTIVGVCRAAQCGITVAGVQLQT